MTCLTESLGLRFTSSSRIHVAAPKAAYRLPTSFTSFGTARSDFQWRSRAVIAFCIALIFAFGAGRAFDRADFRFSHQHGLWTRSLTLSHSHLSFAAK